MIKLFSTLLLLIIFTPAGLLWMVAEILYVVVFLFKMLCSVLATLSLAVGANFDYYTRTYTFNDDIIGTSKRLVAEDISEHLHNLRRASAFFARRH